MKQLITIIIALLIVNDGRAQDNEKRIAFKSGTLKLCTQANLKIKGYNGDEVIIKSLNKQTQCVYELEDFHDLTDGLAKLSEELAVLHSEEIEEIRYLTFSGDEKELEEGLKPLGAEPKDPAEDLYLDITEKPGELIIKDYQSKSGIELLGALSFNNEYEIMVPNSVKLLWNTDDCSKTNSNTFFAIAGSEPSELSNFSGEVEVSLSFGSVILTDVSGPVIANTIGGNINVVFDKTIPTELYSLISGNGYINMELPAKSSLTIVARGSRILSDIDFKVLTEEATPTNKKMNLKLNDGAVMMNLDAGSGTIYLREK